MHTQFLCKFVDSNVRETHTKLPPPKADLIFTYYTPSHQTRPWRPSNGGVNITPGAEEISQLKFRSH